ncbi:outer membrane beta-barrel protein [Chryseolinea sp. H1M3-3]|uniref:outer membrane beta-barrel protein n=1 Tax=Chryseolinea sp. H1M3-3 TaxID=3034144 RepID=UPI0023EA7945|nr:outer membrane beta-barrel protein [Chryseolinea sp. H1M3-3]
MRKIYLLPLCLLANLAFGQKLTIHGVVADSAGTLLPAATVMLLKQADSSLVNFTTSDEQGIFKLTRVDRIPYYLKVTFVGYKTYTKEIDLRDNSDASIDLGILKMIVAKTTLDEVVVEDHIPVVVKKDTIEFDATSFKIAPNANVEDLLKKLPGVEVDAEGNVTAQGEQVKRVTVDGKDFFGGKDPKVATRNLPADAIDKVQVHDRKSDQAIFSGIDDGQREKAINLELKEEKRRAAFGKITAGYGTDDRFQAKANINRFNKGNQLSSLAMGNNVNDAGFSFEDYISFTSAGQQMMGGGQVRVRVNSDNQNGIPLNFGNRANGILTTYAGGVNLNNELSRKSEINASYFYNFLDHDKLQSVSRENFFEQGSFLYTEQTRQNNTNENHRLNVVLDHKIDSTNLLRLSTNFSLSNTRTNSTTSSENISPQSIILNENESHAVSEGSAANLNSNLLYKHRFNNKGRTFSANLEFGLSQIDRNGFLDATYRYEDASSEETVRQRNDQSSENLSYGATATYIEPLGNRKYVESYYSFRQNKNDVERPVYDLRNDSETFNDSLSSQYNSDYTYHRTGVNFKMNRKYLALTIGASFQETQLSGYLHLHDAEISNAFSNLLPVARFNYDFSRTKHLNFDYETTVQEPTIQQLQPVVDNSDPLNPYTGNPTLRPAYQQSWRLHFNSFDPGKMVGLFAFVDVDYTMDAITNAVSIENFIRTTSPVNVSDNLRIRSDITFTFPLVNLNNRFSITGNVLDQRGPSVFDELEYDIVQRNIGGRFRYDYRYKETFDFSLSAQVAHQQTKYEFHQADQKYLNKTFKAETNLSLGKNYQLSGSFDYLIYDSKSTNFHEAIPLLNLAFSRFILKSKAGEIKLSVNNLLDQALGVKQTADLNYIEQTTVNSLGRYFIISFTYSLNKQLNPMNMRRGGGIHIGG